MNKDNNIKEDQNIKISRPSCQNCRWVGCRNYGWNRPACMKYIAELSSK